MITKDCFTITSLAVMLYMVGDEVKPFIKDYRFGLTKLTEEEIVLGVKRVSPRAVNLEGFSSFNIPKNGEYAYLRFLQKQVPRKLTKKFLCSTMPCDIERKSDTWRITRKA